MPDGAVGAACPPSALARGILGQHSLNGICSGSAFFPPAPQEALGGSRSVKTHRFLTLQGGARVKTH
eukprot:7090134-Pyramimonas_sp.AAC.1